MNILDLQTFVEVADAGGISAAARRLDVSKSIVSRRLFRLEAELGVQLLVRTKRGAVLSEAGATFREHAARIGAELEIAKDTILPTGELRGRLRIAMPVSFGPTHFAPVLAELAHRHPKLQIQASYSDRFVDLIAEGFDCAIRVGHLPDSDLMARRIGPITAQIVASPAYIETHGAPQTLADLARHEVLLQGTESWHLLAEGEVISVQPQGRFKADNGVALTAAAVAGLGIASLPDCLTREQLTTGALVPVMTQYQVRPGGAYVVRPPGQHSPRKIRVLTDLLIEHFNNNPQLWGRDL